MNQHNTFFLGFVIIVFSNCYNGIAQELDFFESATERFKQWNKNSNDSANIEYESIQIGNHLKELEGPLAGSLRLPLFCKYIEVTEGQRKKIERANRDFVKAAKQEISRTNDPSQIQQIMKRYGNKQEQFIEHEVLLPHQIKSAKSYDRYRLMVNEGPASSLVEGTLGSQLGLTIEQREALCKDIAEIRSQYEDKIRQARKEAIKKLIDAVPEKKRAAAKKHLDTLVETNILIPKDRFLDAPEKLSNFAKLILRHNGRLKKEGKNNR